MDHDADHIHLGKLKTFMKDFLTISRVTAEEFHAMAEKVRAGGSPQDALDEIRAEKEPAQEPEPVGIAGKPVDGQPADKPLELGADGKSEASKEADGAPAQTGGTDEAPAAGTAQAGSTEPPAAGSGA